MRFEGKRLAFCLTGAYHKIPAVLDLIRQAVAEGAEVTAIVSPATLEIELASGRQGEIAAAVEAITGRRPWTTLLEAERTGPWKLFDLAAGRFIDYWRGLGRLIGPVNRFFDGVLVMAQQQDLRRNRLALCRLVHATFAHAGDLSRLVWPGESQS